MAQQSTAEHADQSERRPDRALGSDIRGGLKAGFNHDWIGLPEGARAARAEAAADPLAWARDEGLLDAGP